MFKVNVSVRCLLSVSIPCCALLCSKTTKTKGRIDDQRQFETAMPDAAVLSVRYYKNRSPVRLAWRRHICTSFLSISPPSFVRFER